MSKLSTAVLLTLSEPNDSAFYSVDCSSPAMASVICCMPLPRLLPYFPVLDLACCMLSCGRQIQTAVESCAFAPQWGPPMMTQQLDWQIVRDLTLGNVYLAQSHQPVMSRAAFSYDLREPKYHYEKLLGHLRALLE